MLQAWSTNFERIKYMAREPDRQCQVVMSCHRLHKCDHIVGLNAVEGWEGVVVVDDGK